MGPGGLGRSPLGVDSHEGLDVEGRRAEVQEHLEFHGVGREHLEGGNLPAVEERRELLRSFLEAGAAVRLFQF